MEELFELNDALLAIANCINCHVADYSQTYRNFHDELRKCDCFSLVLFCFFRDVSWFEFPANVKIL